MGSFLNFATKPSFRATTILFLFLLILSPGVGQARTDLPDSLKTLAQQADYVALVEMDPTPIDSLGYMVDDLGTNHYFPSFKVIKVFKQCISLTEYRFSLIYTTLPGRFHWLYQPGGKYYIFLSANLPKDPDLSQYYLPFGKNGGFPSLLNGGMIEENKLSSRTVARLTKPGPLYKAFQQDNPKKIRRLVRGELTRIRMNSLFHPYGKVSGPEQRLVYWMKHKAGLDGVMDDNCWAKIMIWPGWNSYLMWINTKEGMKEYWVTVQHGTSWRLFCFARYSERLRITTVKKGSGGRDQILQAWEQRRINEKKDAYNNLVQLTLEQGNYNYSTIPAHALTDSQDKLIRLKMTLTNHGDSALFVRWPVQQNSGRKVLYFTLFNKKTRQTYREPLELRMTHDETLGPDEVLLIAGGSVSRWHTLNDPFNATSEVCANHLFDTIPPGEYQVMATYRPYDDTLAEHPCWRPFVDSITAWTGYPNYVENVKNEGFRIKARVVSNDSACTNHYQLKGWYQGLVTILETNWKEGPPPGQTIAWQIIPGLPPDTLFHGRPAYDFELLNPGDLVELELNKNNAGEVAVTSRGTYSRFATFRGIYSIKRLLTED